MLASARMFSSIFSYNKDLPFKLRILRAYDKTLLFRQHSKKQFQQLNKLANIKQPSFIDVTYQKGTQAFNNIVNKVKQIRPQQYIPVPAQVDFNQIMNNKQVKTNTQKAFQFILSHSIIFYNSIEALVEGRRQVLSNPDLKLWDGQTVETKQQRFEKYVNYIISKINSK